MAENKLVKTDKPKREFTEVFSATNKKNPKPEDIAALREMMKEDASIWQTYGDWGKQTEDVLISEYFESSGLVLESVKKKLVELRKELDWQNAGALEKLLIRQICLTWLRLYFIERQHHQNTYTSHTLTVGIYWDKRLNEAQRRHIKAIESLAKVRKMTFQTAILEAEADKAKAAQNFNPFSVLDAMTRPSK